MEIIIRMPDLAAAVNDLAMAIHALASARVSIAEISPQQTYQPAITSPVETPEPNEKPLVMEKTTPATETTKPGVNIPSVVDLRAKAQEVGRIPANKQAIKMLLEKYGSKSISSLPEEHRATFLADLEVL